MTCNSLQTIVATAWNKHAKTKLVSIRSKSWWNSECSCAKAVFDDTRSKNDYNTLRKITRETKCSFYKKRIQNISLEAKQPWDLVEWTKPRHLPTHKSISYNGEVCTTLPQLWDSIHVPITLWLINLGMRLLSLRLRSGRKGTGTLLVLAKFRKHYVSAQTLLHQDRITCLGIISNTSSRTMIALRSSYALWMPVFLLGTGLSISRFLHWLSFQNPTSQTILLLKHLGL